MKTHNKLSTLLILSLLICLGLSQITVSQVKTEQNLQKADQISTPFPSKSTQLSQEKKVQVTQRSGNYYGYNVYSSNGSILIDLYTSQVKQYIYSISSKDNTLYFRDAYNKFIILQQMTTDNKSVTYWLFIVTQTIIQSTSTYVLDYYPVNSKVDNEGYEFNNSYLLTNIIEYNEVTNFLYVVMDTTTDYNTYGIDLSNRGNIMIVIGYFYYSTTVKEKITGGNSRVLVQSTTDSLWFNTGNIVSSYIASIFNKVSVSSLTSYPIYPQSSRAYSFLSSYFQYVSLSSDGLSLTTFIFKDYVQTTTIYAEASINSTSQPIKIFSDEQTFFLAISDNDIYVSTVTWNTSILDYSIYSTKLTEFLSDEDQINKWLQVFNSVLIVVIIKGEYFMLSEEYFYVYSQTETYEQKLSSKVSSSSNLKGTLYTYMKKYLSNK